MRMIGSIQDEAAASNFRDYLLVQGIENQLEKEPGGHWSIWVHADDELDRAIRYLAEFKAKPDDSRFHLAKSQAEELRARQEANQEAFDKRFHNREEVFRPMGGYGFGPLTLTLIVACVIVYFYRDPNNANSSMLSLYITDPTSFSALRSMNGTFWDRLAALKEIRHGEIWRLITPIFLHFTIAHILFDMLMLRDFGNMIESRLSSLYLLLLVVVIAAVSNVAQMAVNGPGFGGMSGVVYGLFGYIWIRGKFDPFCGLFLHKTIVTMGLIWFFACLFQLIPHVANTVHTVGLGVGMLWGYIDAKR